MKSSSTQVTNISKQLSAKADSLNLRVGRHTIPLTSLNKIFWPKTRKHRAYTKRDLIQYYVKISPLLLPHLKDRPITLKRYPHGIHGPFFFQKHVVKGLPSFVKTVPVFSASNKADKEFLVANNLATIIYFLQLGDIDMHPWYSRIVKSAPDPVSRSIKCVGSKTAVQNCVLNFPDFLVFDLDPYIYSGKEKKSAEPERNRRAFDATKTVAHMLKETLENIGLRSFIKTSGKTGLHMYVPIKRNVTYEQTRAFAKTIGEHLVKQEPKLITMEWSVAKRRGKIFFDHNQNSLGKTLASIYSVRPHEDATISMPIDWDNLDKIRAANFTLETAQKLLGNKPDLWKSALTKKQDLQQMKGTIQ